MTGEFRIRVTYALTGRLVMLSHLETVRALERAVRRSGLPFAVTQGFSPHMKLAFGAALPVGVGGTEEIFDVALTEYVAPDRTLAMLQAVSAPDMMPCAVRYIHQGEKAASVAYPFSTYEVRFSDSVEGLRMPDEVLIVRKKKEKRLVPSDFLIGEPQFAGDMAVFTLEAKDTGSLRPDVLTETMIAGTDLRIRSIMRVKQQASV